ncbi:MAG: hypothetical protein ABIX01_10440 [Chitinophagaceae bacterium]
MRHSWVFIVILLSCQVPCYSQRYTVSDAGSFLNDDPIHSSSEIVESLPFAFFAEIISPGSVVNIKTKKHSGFYIGLGANHDTLFIAGYKRYRLHGTWQSWYADKSRRDSGRFDKNMPDGAWKSWFPDGRLRSIRWYSASKLATLKNDIKLFNPKTTLDRLAMLDKQQPGTYGYFTNAAYSFKTVFPFGKKNAQLPAVDAGEIVKNGDVKNACYKPPFSQCFHDGLYVNLYPTGELKDSGYYANGLRTGVWIEKIDDGKIIAKGAYGNGFRSGSWSFYTGNGKLLSLKYYDRQGREMTSKYY